MSLINSQETVTNWNNVASKIADKQKRNPEDTLIMRSNWDARRKIEVTNLIDLSENMEEKYGVPWAHQIGLRMPDAPKPQLVEYKSKQGALIFDDRDKKIEIIREIPTIRSPKSPSIASRF